MSLIFAAREEILKIVDQAMLNFDEIPVEAWDQKTSADKWSKKELLGHLVDSASNNLRRMIIAQYEQGSKIVYDQEKWVECQHYQTIDIQDVKLLWSALNRHLAHVIGHIPQSKLDNTCDTGSGKSEVHSVVYFIEDYLVHLNHHLNQIFSHFNYSQKLTSD